jgi:hypothetical protein
MARPIFTPIPVNYTGQYADDHLVDAQQFGKSIAATSRLGNSICHLVFFGEVIAPTSRHQIRLFVNPSKENGLLQELVAIMSSGALPLFTPALADQMIAALSSAFKQGVKRGNSTGLKANPCLGMDKAHEANPNANREWFPGELAAALAKAPMEIKIPLMVARYIGLRGQTIVRLNRKQFTDHPMTGKAVRYLARKNKAEVFLPVLPEFQSFMAELTIVRSDGLIAVRDNGQPWVDEVEMQTRVSHFLRDLERDGAIGANTTLHGLRSSYAAWWKRMGATDREIADLLGDKSERMGGHYSRHVAAEANVTRAFDRLKALDQE